MSIERARELALYEENEQAEALLVAIVASTPNDLDAQLLLARVRHVRGDDDFARSLREASLATDAPMKLRTAYADTLRRVGEVEAAAEILHAQLDSLGPRPEIASALSVLMLETQRYEDAADFARVCFEAWPKSANAAENLVCALLSSGRAADASSIVRDFKARYPFDQRWLTYTADIARELGDPEGISATWCDYEKYVRTYELEAPAGYSSMQAFHEALEPFLDSRHGRFGAHPLDQTLRSGTETSMGLVGNREPVSSFFEIIDEPIRAYQAELGGCDATHPLLARNTAPASVVGCWSVRLRRGGFHVNHTHPLGWISSAYYVSVPGECEADDDKKSGWLKFGEPLYRTPNGKATHFVKPRPGLLVLFPSYFWHGTMPIQGDDKRLSIAFDAVP